MPQSDVLDLLTDVRSQVIDIKHILLGNGSVGLCEQTRQNTRDIQTLATTVSSLAQSVRGVSESQNAHQDWHADTRNMTIQQVIAKPGFLFVPLLMIGVLVLIGAAVGIEAAVATVKAWL